MSNLNNSLMGKRFRGLLPVVVDIETSGLNPATDAMLEIAVVTLSLHERGLTRKETLHFHIEPFPGANLEKEALEINRIDPYHPFRFAIPEAQALHRIFAHINQEIEANGCYRAVLVGHNAWFDLSFMLAAARRSGIKPIPFHTFTTFDTATLSALAYGETVLARATRRAKIPFDIKEAHSAIYDAERTAELFCQIINKFK